MESSRLGGYITQYDHTNNSTARQKFTFGKGGRFPTIKKTLNTRICYDLPTTKSRRTTSFGVGHRFSTPMAQRSSKFYFLVLIDDS
jgi:hypothetical protein